jgi:hypothetical protein
MDNTVKHTTQNIIECPNCHSILASDEPFCSVCKFNLVVKDDINIEKELECLE